MSGDGSLTAISGLLPKSMCPRSKMSFAEALEISQKILDVNGFKNLIEVGVAGSTDSNEGLMLVGDFPLNGKTAQNYLKAKSEILKTTKMNLFAYEYIEHNQVYVTPA